MKKFNDKIIPITSNIKYKIAFYDMASPDFYYADGYCGEIMYYDYEYFPFLTIHEFFDLSDNTHEISFDFEHNMNYNFTLYIHPNENTKQWRKRIEQNLVQAMHDETMPELKYYIPVILHYVFATMQERDNFWTTLQGV